MSKTKSKKLCLTNATSFDTISLSKLDLIRSDTSKLGKIPNLNMPKGLSCRPDAPCLKGCYCNHGNMSTNSCKKGHKTRMDLYLANPQLFFEKLSDELKWMRPLYFRWHSAGDIVDEKYLDLMCWLARKHKETKFLCFTKKFELVNEYLDNHKKPNNLVLVLSNWGEWKAENPHNLPMSYVDFGKGTDGIPAKAYRCPGRCEECDQQHCWQMKKGDAVAFHKH